MSHTSHTRTATYLSVALLVGGIAYFGIPHLLATTYTEGEDTQVAAVAGDTLQEEELPPVTTPVTDPTAITHIKTPEPLKALYMTSWVAGTNSMRDHVIKLVDTTEANAIVVDLKDYTGRVAYPVEDPELKKLNVSEKRIPNLRAYTNLLHEKGIYIIGRVAIFQDPEMVRLHPEWAVKTLSDKSKIWKDRKGITWLDAGNKEVWDYMLRIAKDAHAQGVDEINFDYIRFPSDGNMKDIYFPASDGKSKQETITAFMKYVHDNLAGTGITTSADLFGLTTTATNSDLGIGQNLEAALVNFDYVMPMVYPSHFGAGWNGFKNPNAMPYETIKVSMTKAAERAKAIGEPVTKLRPWLQDFSLGTPKYGATEVRAQIKGTYDAGLTSWLMWDPSNKFTAGALLPQ